MEEEKIKELENQIDEWQKELDEVWKGKETDAAEVERRNLKSLIQNAKREINQLRGIDEKVVEGNPEELLEELKNGKAENEKAKKRIELSIERLEDEKIAYESKKNVEYKDIYQEYENKIDKLKKQLEELEGKQIEGKDEKIKILTQGRMKEEEEINKIEIEIRKKELEISEIKYGTEEALEEKELSDGTKIKMPKILSKYEELDELKKSLKERTEKRDEYQKYINELKGIEKEEKLEYTKQQVEEYTKYFHGQGDKQENTRDDKRGNDEYFGFEKVREGRKTNEQPKIKPTGKESPSKKEKKNNPADNKKNSAKEINNAKVQLIEINENDNNIYFKDSEGKTGNINANYAFEDKNRLMKKLCISKQCREIAGGRLNGFFLKRKLNPEILCVLEKYPEQCKEYIENIHDKQKPTFDMVHNLENISLIDRFKLNRFVRNERKSGILVLGGLLNNKITDSQRKEARTLMEGKNQDKKENEWIEKVENKDNRLEKSAIEKMEKEAEGEIAEDVNKIMSER